MYKITNVKSQQGMATMAITLILLFIITLVTLYTANTSVREQEISANQYRADQAFAAANAGMDWALDYFDEYGADQCSGSPCVSNNVIDYTSGSKYSNTITENGLSTVGSVYFLDKDGGTDPDNQPLSIVSEGRSDDNTAAHTIKVEVISGNVMGNGGGPDFPVVAHGSAGFGGTITIINRFTHKTVWTGADVGVGGSSDTWVADHDLDCTQSASSPSIRARCISHPGRGNYSGDSDTIAATESRGGLNSEIIDNDDNLRNMTGDEFFMNFFIEDRPSIERFARSIDQWYAAGSVSWDQLVGKESLVWISGDVSINGGSAVKVGTKENPLLVVIDGDLRITGVGSNLLQLVGMLYVAGDLAGSGNWGVQGSVVVEGSEAGLHGNPKIIYDADIFDGAFGSSPGDITAVVPGTWEDWSN